VKPRKSKVPARRSSHQGYNSLEGEQTTDISFENVRTVFQRTAEKDGAELVRITMHEEPVGK